MYLCFIVAVGSETLYMEVHSNAASAVALFISAVIYGGITAYYYYMIYMNLDRKEELKRWIREERLRKGLEMGSIQRMEEHEQY